MNERAKALLDERFGEWVEAVEGWWCRRLVPDGSNVVPYSHYGVRCWLSSPAGVRFATADEAKSALDAALLRSVIEPVVEAKWGPWINVFSTTQTRGAARAWKIIGTTWAWWSDISTGVEQSEDAAKLAADFALYCEIVDDKRFGDKLEQKDGYWVPKKDERAALAWSARRPFELQEFLEGAKNTGVSAPMPSEVLFSEGFESVPWPLRIPVSFRARLADEWELRPDGKHVRKATWEGVEFVAIEIVTRGKYLGGRLRCPAQKRQVFAIDSCGWSKKDRRYLSQLWALWSEHHQEVPGADWREVAKARLGVK